MDAKEARNLAISSVNDKIEEIVKDIRKAAEQGDTSISLPYLNGAIKAWLTQQGYIVTHEDALGYGFDKVSWSDAR